MRVMKFGGTSLESATRLETVVGLIQEASAEGPVVVVTSAVAGVTDLLTGLVESKGPPTQESLEGLANFLWTRHLDLHPSDSGEVQNFHAGLEEILGDFRRVGDEAVRSGEWSPSAKDKVLGVGERATALLVSSLLTLRGVPSIPIRGRDVIRTDSSFGCAQVLERGTLHLARWTLGRVPSGTVPIVAGFTGSDEAGRPTTLGRGSSDLSATLIARAVSARVVEIWTDVDGVHDLDPRQSQNARILPHLTYAQARSLAEEGAKVLHPRSLDPIEGPGIPLKVRNSLRPEAQGTWIGPSPLSRTSTRDTKRVHLILAGVTGGVGRTFLQQLTALAPSLKEEGTEVLVSGAFSTRAQLWNREGIPLEEVPGHLIPGPRPDWVEVTKRLAQAPPENPVFVDCTASREVSDQYARILAGGASVITPNKLAWSGSLAEYRGIREAAQDAGIPFRYETTVGAALPILRTVRDLKAGGDQVRNITGVLSGTLSFVFAKLAEGIPFSQAVRQARDSGFTEPHPRDDLTGGDVARKLLILLRETGLDLEPDAIPVESLVPSSLSEEDDPEKFLEGLEEFDHLWADRVREAEGKSLSYLAWFDGTKAGVGVQDLPAQHPLARLRATENMVLIESDRYPEIPLTIAGPGAGREVTASGVLADFLDAVRVGQGRRRVA
jgi:aspartate kinase